MPPPRRAPNITFIFQVREPPTLTGAYNDPVYKNFFNLTLTYRKDSDLFGGFAKIIPANAKVHKLRPICVMCTAHGFIM